MTQITIEPAAWRPGQPTIEELDLCVFASSRNAVLVLRTAFDGTITDEIDSVIVREERCLVRVWHESLYSRFKAERTEGVVWDLGWGATPEAALESLGPEPQPWTPEAYLAYVAARNGSRPGGPAPRCECGQAELELHDNLDKWSRYELVCPACGQTLEVRDNRAFDAWAKSRRKPSDHRVRDAYGDPVHWITGEETEY